MYTTNTAVFTDSNQQGAAPPNKPQKDAGFIFSDVTLQDLWHRIRSECGVEGWEEEKVVVKGLKNSENHQLVFEHLLVSKNTFGGTWIELLRCVCGYAVPIE